MVGVGSHELAVLLAAAFDSCRPCWWCHATGGGVVSDLAVRELRESDWDYWDAWLAQQPGDPHSPLLGGLAQTAECSEVAPCSSVALMERKWQAVLARIPLC
jgi:hypothetical protein